MARDRPPTSGYAQIAQAEREEDYYESDEERDRSHPVNPVARDRPLINTHAQPLLRQGMLSGPGGFANEETTKSDMRRQRRYRSSSAVDVKAINARLERWAEEIAQKFRLRKIKGKTLEEERLEIHHSVFQAPDNIQPATAEYIAASAPSERMTKVQFDKVVESVRVAIEQGIHPKMISQGSSGSYFARDSEGKTVGIFKPKDEEPYASRNPKWTKWIHRNLFPFFFGRACLIPNLSYVSEAAAYVLDQRLQIGIVPHTDIVEFSSLAFNHDFWDRRAFYRRRKALPPKVGSFQAFLEGFQDASIFLKQHPWPDSACSTHLTQSRSKRKRRRWAEECRPRVEDNSSDEDEPANQTEDVRAESPGIFWTEDLKHSCREQLERLVILDYIMRNTDRGLDNWMLKVETSPQKPRVTPNRPSTDDAEPAKAYSNPFETENQDPFEREQPMTTSSGSRAALSTSRVKFMSLGAIDNSLSWPWKHPDAWRSYPFGWLFLPVSLIGLPFTENTRQHFIPLLTSKQWWSDTQVALRRCFEQDSDFKERMFARQVAVMKGQAWNVVETLKTADHGPLELTRRARVCVWDDLVDIPTIVPLRTSPAESRRKRIDIQAAHEGGEEIDISTAHFDTTKLSQSSERPPSPPPRPNLFDIPRGSSAEDVFSRNNKSSGTYTPSAVTKEPCNNLDDVTMPAYHSRRPEPLRSRTRVSYDDARPANGLRREANRPRNKSASLKRIDTSLWNDYRDDIEGDLGYAAAEDMEGNSRKVIVERLENVTGKNPFFTWC